MSAEVSLKISRKISRANIMNFFTYERTLTTLHSFLSFTVFLNPFFHLETSVFPDCQNKDDRLKPIIRSECIKCLWVGMFVCFFNFFSAFSGNFLRISLRNLRIVSNYYQAADVWVFLSLMFCHLLSIVIYPKYLL